MNKADYIDEELENCFINISETNTEDEIFKNKMARSQCDSEVGNSNRTATINTESSFAAGKDNSNPNLIFKKEKEIVTKGKSSIKNLSNNLKNKVRSSSKNKNKNESNFTSNITSNNKNETLINKMKVEHNEIKVSLQNELELANKKIHETQKALFQIRQEKIILEDENGILKLEKEKIGSIKDTQIATFNEKLMKFEIENNQLKDMNDFSKKRLEEYSPKVYKYDELYEKYSKLSLENERLLENNSTINNLLLTIKKEKEELVSRFEVMRMENEALKNDKFYLSKESMTLNEKVLNSTDRIKTLEEDIREMRKTNQNYLDKLTEKNLNIGNSFEEKLRVELEDMKKKYENDKENLKRLFEELSDKRCAYLTEEKEEYKHKANKCEKIIKDKEETTEFMNTEMRNFTKKTDEELSFLRVQLKIKGGELERISNIYEENVNIIKILKNENESYKDKHDLIRSELIKKEADYRTEISEYKSQLIMMKDKIANYEQIENELDKVIIDSAYLANEDDKSNEVMSIIKDIPTCSKRRISQCLVLANKLKLMTIELEKLKDLNKRLEDQVKSICDERDLFKSVAEKSKQPYSYLIKNLQDLELELYKKNYQFEEKDQSIRSLLRENEMLNEKVKSVEADMKVILNNRKKLDNLEDIIAKFIQSDAERDVNVPNENKYATSPNYFSLSKNSNGNSMSTKFNTKMMSQNLNMMSPINNPNNQNNLVEIPERDNNNNSMNLSMPKWYKTLKMKEKMKY